MEIMVVSQNQKSKTVATCTYSDIFTKRRDIAFKTGEAFIHGSWPRIAAFHKNSRLNKWAANTYRRKEKKIGSYYENHLEIHPPLDSVTNESYNYIPPLLRGSRVHSVFKHHILNILHLHLPRHGSRSASFSCLPDWKSGALHPLLHSRPLLHFLDPPPYGGILVLDIDSYSVRMQIPMQESDVGNSDSA